MTTKANAHTTFLKRLNFAFFITFLSFSSVIAFTFFSVERLHILNANQKNYIFIRTDNAINIRQEFNELRRSIELAPDETIFRFTDLLHIENETGDVVGQFVNMTRDESITFSYERIKMLGNSYISNLLLDTSIPAGDEEVRHIIMTHILDIADSIYEMHTSNENIDVHHILAEVATADSSLQFLLELAINLNSESISTVYYNTHVFRLVLVLLAALALTALITVFLYSRMRFKAMSRLHNESLLAIAKGTYTTASTEDGEFSFAISEISDTFDAIIAAIDTISHEITVQKYSQPLDVLAFKGNYQKIATAINELITVITNERESNEFKQLVVDTNPLVSSIWSKDLKMLDTSQEVVRRYGVLSKREYLHRFFEFSPKHQPDGERSSEKAKRLVLETFQSGYSEFEWLHQDVHGNLIPTAMKLFVAKYQGEDVVISFATDIRSLKKSNEELNKTIGRMDTVLQNIPLLVEYWDENYKRVFVNDSHAMPLSDLEQEEARDVTSFNIPEFQPCGTPSAEFWIKKLADLFGREDGITQDDWSFVSRSETNEPIYYDVHAVISDYHGKRTIIVYLKDITDLKDAIEASAVEKQKADALKINSDSKTSFLAKISHEIRTPISTVLGISEIQILNEHHKAETTEAFARIHSSASALLTIVNDILDLSKIEAGTATLKLEPYDLPVLISEISNLNSDYVANKNIDFKLDINPKLPKSLIGTETRIKQVINNILSNSFKYTEVGYVRLGFDFEILDINTNEVNLIIVVQDTGKGMNDEKVRALFDETYLVDNNANRFTKGTGLGISITRNFIGLMNGTLTIDSKPNVGTTVTIVLPQQAISTDIMGQEITRHLKNYTYSMYLLSQQKGITSDLEHGNVLIVDDVDANLYVTRGLLSRYDLDIHTCTSGFDAIEKIKSGKTYDLILMDQMMPGINGAKTTLAIRQLGYTKPIVAFTANSVSNNPDDYLHNGFDGFLAKPIQIAALETILQQFIPKHSTADGFVEANAERKPEVEVSTARGDGYDYLNDPDIIREIRQELKTDYFDSTYKIRNYLNNSDIESARRIFHTVKSLSNMLAEQELADVSKELEILLLTQDFVPEDKLQRFDTLLARLLTSIH